MRYFALLLWMLSLPFAQAASASKTEQLDAELVSESSTLAPGATTWLGLRLKHAPGWHTYWINPGDSGLPTKLKWTLSPGYRTDDIDWPTPKRFSVGELANFGYDGEVVLPIALHVPADAGIGKHAHLIVDVRWLVCHEECIPGRATLTLDLPIAAQSQIDPQWRSAFATVPAARPQGEPLKASARDTSTQIEVSLPHGTFSNTAKLDAFAVQTKVVANAPPVTAKRDGSIVLIFAKSDYFTSIPDALDLVIVPTRGGALRAHAPFAATSNPSKSPP